MIKCKKILPTAILPKRGRDGDAGLDLFTAEECYLKGNETKAISTGIAFEIPYGMEGEIRPRSGISLYGYEGVFLQVIQSTIDSNYRGETHIIVYNPSNKEVYIPIGTRLSQIIINYICTDDLVFVDELTETNRNENKFGSSGIK